MQACVWPKINYNGKNNIYILEYVYIWSLTLYFINFSLSFSNSSSIYSQSESTSSNQYTYFSECGVWSVSDVL